MMMSIRRLSARSAADIGENMKIKKLAALVLAIFILISSVGLASCSDASETENNGKDEPSGTLGGESEVMTDEKKTERETEKETQKNPIDRAELLETTKFVPTVYGVDEIVDADKTVAGSFEAWHGEVVKNGKNNDEPTENAVIHSPFHTLKVNGVEVPVYTARCTTGAHSFAWIDITNAGDFLLEIELELGIDIGKCVVLPESRGGDLAVNSNKVIADIYETGSYTFTFEADSAAKITDPTLAPLTLMVERDEGFVTPADYKTVEIEPGYHDNYALEFTESNTVYVFKAGFHEISSIGIPSNSVLYIERGAYLQVTDRKNDDGKQNTLAAIHADDVENVKIISRGLLDCGKLQGGDYKYKHVVNTARSKNVLINGLTVINSNTWTICAYGSENSVIEKNLLLGYRMYSDGIMMSECVGCTGRYNFVRTGDDAIEFKGTGWWNGGEKRGVACVYEYNDLWTDKGAGYCLTWESERPMSTMKFRNNSVGFAQPTWTDRNTALDCLLGTNPDTVWENVTFENIEIYHVKSPNAINVQIQGKGAKLDNIVFKNITVKTARKGVYAFRMHFSADGGSIGSITLDNVEFCGQKLTADDTENKDLFCNQAKKYFKNLIVK
jgi:hypothetical protein